MQEGTSPLSDVRERMRKEVEEALDRARRELAGWERRCQELREEIQQAEAFLGLEEDGGEGEGQMTLHGAMELILKEWGPTRITKLADEIDKRGLYRRRDGKPPGAHQIHARVHNYDDMFERVSPGVVGLK